MIRNGLLLFLFVLAGTVQGQKINLLYFTDAHRIFPVDDVEGGRGGVARLKTIVDKFRKENPNTLVIHGGDLCGGVLFGGMYKGIPMIEAFNEIPVDLCNFGQHEFDFGTEHTIHLLSKSKSEWFTSNLKDRDGEAFANLPQFLVKHQGGTHIGFIGLTDAMNTTVKDDAVIQEDLFVAVAELLESKNLRDIDFLVVVSQTSLEINQNLLEQFPQIDLIVTEEQYEKESNVFYKGSVPIVATAGNMSSVAAVSLEKNKNPLVEIIPLDHRIHSHKGLREMELYYKRDMEVKLSEKLGYLEVPLSFRDGITGESLAGNLVTDAFRECYNSDVGIVNAGGIRADIPAGILRLKSVRSLLPFGNKVCQIVSTGYELKELLRKHVNDKKGQLLHVSGICYEYSKTTDELTVEWKGKQLDDEELLTVSLNTYLLDHLTGDFGIRIDESHPDAVEDFVALRNYCEKQKRILPKLEGRIKMIGE